MFNFKNHLIFSNNNKLIGTKTKFLILDIIDLKNECWGIYDEDQLTKKDYLAPKISSKSRKNSEIPGRKSSINPSNVEYIRRSRFNSIADELKTSKIENPTLIMDELVNSLGADIDFYQCFRLTEEEFVRKYLLILLLFHNFGYKSIFEFIKN